MTKTADELVQHWNSLKSERSSFERTWQDVADHIRPLRSDFTATRQPGDRRNRLIFDSTPMMAADNFAGGVFGMMTNPANRWFALKLEDEALDDYAPARTWLYDVETRLLSSIGPQVSRFYNAIPALYADLACFGTAVFSSEEAFADRWRILDRCHALADVCIAENALGDVDTVYRRVTIEARNAPALFGERLSRDA